MSNHQSCGPPPAVELARAAVVGAGLIGASMAAMFAAAGVDVRVWDPNAGGKQEFDRRCERARRQLEILGIAGRGQVVWTQTLGQALDGVQWVQENAPESVDIKHKLYSEIEAAAPKDAVIASSTSALTWTELSGALKNPLRHITAHPFNPAHLIPLIELYGRDDATVQFAEAVFKRLGKQTVRLKRDAVGHIANRLASALWREAVHIVADGIADVEAVDAALVYGPGLRWSVAGAHMNYHLGGGTGGIKQYLQVLGPSQERRWATLGNPKLTPEVCEALIAGIEREASGSSIEELEDRRDRQLIELLKLRQTMASVSASLR